MPPNPRNADALLAREPGESRVFYVSRQFMYGHGDSLPRAVSGYHPFHLFCRHLLRVLRYQEVR